MSIRICYHEIVNIISKDKTLGDCSLDNGTILIGHVPHVAPEAYLHAIFGPLDKREVHIIEGGLQRTLPLELVELFHLCNGMSVYSDSLSIDGLRNNYRRSGNDIWQPYNIITPNIHERPRGAPEDYIFFGGYGYDASLLCICPCCKMVYRTKKREYEELNEWENLEEMLLSEVIRMSDMFDEDGKMIDPSIPTTP